MNNRGSALWESLAIVSVIFLVASGSLTLGYFSLARSWLLYQGEQALYCVAEGKPTYECRAKYEVKARAFLPWGRLQIQILNRAGSGAVLRAEWICKNLKFKIYRNLDLRRSALSQSLR